MRTAANIKDVIIAAQACIVMVLYITGSIVTLPHTTKGKRIALQIMTGTSVSHILVMLCWIAFALKI